MEMLISNADLSFEIPSPKPIFEQIWAKKVKESFMLKNWHKWYLDDAESYSNNSFLNFQPKIHFWANLGQKNSELSFCLKIGTNSILKTWILVPTLVFWISKPKSIFGSGITCFYLEGADLFYLKSVTVEDNEEGL